MPTYEYQCTACEHAWETEQSIKAEPLTECPSCNGATAKRLISRGTGFILKDGGAAGPAAPPSPVEKRSGDASAAFHQRFEQVSGIKTGE